MNALPTDGHKVQWFILVHITRATIIRNSFLTTLNSSFEWPKHWGRMVHGWIGCIPEHLVKINNPLGTNKILLYSMENGILYVTTIPTEDCTNNQQCNFVIKFSLDQCIIYSRMTPSGTHDVFFTNSHRLIEAEWRIYASVNLPSLVQIIGCRLIGAKPLSEPTLVYC